MIKEKFWKRYSKANELQQRDILKELTGVEEGKQGFFPYMTLSLFKSYIDDALEFAKSKDEVKN